MSSVQRYTWSMLRKRKEVTNNRVIKQSILAIIWFTCILACKKKSGSSSVIPVEELAQRA
jgi:hypothetical protein